MPFGALFFLMGVIVKTSDFVGKYAIPQGAFDDLDPFIDSVEEDYLNDLLGADLYADFKAKYIANPAFPDNPGYKKILDKFTTDYGSKVFKSKGIVAMLCGFIFFDYMSVIKFKASSQGMVVTTSDTAQPTGVANLYQFLNDATETFQSIQAYVQSIKPELFPPVIDPKTVSFNGQDKGFGIPIFN
jgi:hypothetical protein